MRRYAIIGFGGLGKVHYGNLLEIEKQRGDIRLCAIANTDLSAINRPATLNIANISMENADFSKCNLYTDYKELLEKEKPDFVVCTLPTYLHANAAVTAMKNGADVYCEKPMALTKEQCIEMAKIAEKYNKKLMIGQILRFSPEYIKCREIIDSGEYGKVLRGEFVRKSPLPDWSYQNWMLDINKSGGCLVDMHVHDVDIINWMFGKAKSVVSHSTHHKAEFESVYSTFEYDDKFISAIADWGLPSKFEFEYRFCVAFEKAFLEFKNGCMTIITDNDVQKISYDEIVSDFYGEIEEFVDCVVNDKEFTTVKLASVMDSMQMVFAEAESAKTGERIELLEERLI